MALKTLNNFKAQLTGGGARPNLFEITMAFPKELTVAGGKQSVTEPSATGSTSESMLTYMCKAAALPASNITPIEIPFRGRTLKVAGERTFDTWTITVLNDTDFKIRTAFEQWMNGISRISDASGDVNPANYQQDATVSQLDRLGQEMRKYKFVGIFPTNISQIDLSMDSTDTIEEYTVEFQVQYWEAVASGSDTTKPAIS